MALCLEQDLTRIRKNRKNRDHTMSYNVNMVFVRFLYLAQARHQSRLSFLAGGTWVRGKGGSVDRL